MIVLVGTKSFNQKNGSVTNSECPECKSICDFNYSVYKRYTYLTFLPLFPVDSVIQTGCSHCKKTFDYDKLPHDIRDKMIQQEKNTNFKTPIWMFSGTIILIGWLSYIAYNYSQKDDQTAVYINNTIVGDVYSLKFSNGYYSTTKIDRVTSDSVYAIDNDFNAYLFYETDDIDQQENYTDKFVRFSKMDLKRQFNEGTIYSIKRK